MPPASQDELARARKRLARAQEIVDDDDEMEQEKQEARRKVAQYEAEIARLQTQQQVEANAALVGDEHEAFTQALISKLRKFMFEGDSPCGKPVLEKICVAGRSLHTDIERALAELVDESNEFACRFNFKREGTDGYDGSQIAMQLVGLPGVDRIRANPDFMGTFVENGETKYAVIEAKYGPLFQTAGGLSKPHRDRCQSQIQTYLQSNNVKYVLLIELQDVCEAQHLKSLLEQTSAHTMRAVAVGIVVERMLDPLWTGVPMGLANPGINICFANSLIQALISLPEVCSSVLRLSPTICFDGQGKPSPAARGFQVLGALKDVVSYLTAPNRQTTAPTTALVNALSRDGKRSEAEVASNAMHRSWNEWLVEQGSEPYQAGTTGYPQMDPAELFAYIIETLGFLDELPRGEDEPEEPRLDKMVSFKLQHMLVDASGVERAPYGAENASSLLVPIECPPPTYPTKAFSLEALVDAFHRGDELPLADALRTGEPRPKSWIRTAPELLVLHLARSDGQRLIHTPVLLAETLTIYSKHVDGTPFARKYRLASILLHEGTSPKTGHYTAHCLRNPMFDNSLANARAFLFNDDKVTEFVWTTRLEDKQVQTQCSMLFYYAVEAAPKVGPEALPPEALTREVNVITAARQTAAEAQRQRSGTSKLDRTPLQDLEDYVKRVDDPLKELQAQAQISSNGDDIPYVKDIMRAIAHTANERYEILKQFDKDLCAFMKDRSSPQIVNPQLVCGPCRKGKSLTAAFLLFMALERGCNILLGFGPDVNKPTAEWFHKLVEQGFKHKYGITGRNRKFDYSVGAKAIRICMYAINNMRDLKHAKDFLDESREVGVPVILALDEAQEIQKGKGLRQDVAVTEKFANDHFYTKGVCFHLCISATNLPAILKSGGGVSIFDLSQPIRKPITPSASKCFVSADSMRLPSHWMSMRQGQLKYTVIDDDPERSAIKLMHRDFLRKKHPQDGAILSNSNAKGKNKQIFGMAMYVPTSYVRAENGGLIAWRDEVLMGETRELKASCVFILVTMNFEVTVMVNGEEVSTLDGEYAQPTVRVPDYRSGGRLVERPSTTIQHIIDHYHSKGIDRFAYLGARCLKASLTTATLTEHSHFITMYVLCMQSEQAKLDQMTQLFGRANTDMGDYVLAGPRREDTEESEAPMAADEPPFTSMMSSDETVLPFCRQGDCYWLEALFRKAPRDLSQDEMNAAVRLEDGGEDELGRPMLRYMGEESLHEGTILRYNDPAADGEGSNIFLENRSGHFTWVLANDAQMKKMQDYVKVELGMYRHWEEQNQPLVDLLSKITLDHPTLLGKIGARGMELEKLRNHWAVPQDVADLLERWITVWEQHHQAQKPPEPQTILGITVLLGNRAGELLARETMIAHKFYIEQLFIKGLLQRLEDLDNISFNNMFPAGGKPPHAKDVPPSGDQHVQKRWRYLFPREAAFLYTNDERCLADLLECIPTEADKLLFLEDVSKFEKVASDKQVASGDYLVRYKYVGEDRLDAEAILPLHDKYYLNVFDDREANNDEDEGSRSSLKSQNMGRIFTYEQKKHAMKAIRYFKEFLRGMQPPPEAQGGKSRGVPFFRPRPRGAAPKGKVWNYQEGTWIDDPDPPKEKMKPTASGASDHATLQEVAHLARTPGANRREQLDQLDRMEKQLQKKKKKKQVGFAQSDAQDDPILTVAPRAKRTTRAKDPTYSDESLRRQMRRSAPESDLESVFDSEGEEGEEGEDEEESEDDNLSEVEDGEEGKEDEDFEDAGKEDDDDDNGEPIQGKEKDDVESEAVQAPMSSKGKRKARVIMSDDEEEEESKPKPGDKRKEDDQAATPAKRPVAGQEPSSKRGRKKSLPKDVKWQSLDKDARAAAQALGWKNQREWDAFHDATDKSVLTEPPAWLLTWDKLDPLQCQHTQTLGFNQSTWGISRL